MTVKSVNCHKITLNIGSDDCSSIKNLIRVESIIVVLLPLFLLQKRYFRRVIFSMLFAALVDSHVFIENGTTCHSTAVTMHISVVLTYFSLFSKLALLLRQRLTAFGHDVQISVRCLQTLVQAIDARSVIYHTARSVTNTLWCITSVIKRCKHFFSYVARRKHTALV